MPGVGKTYFGRYAATQLGVAFIDLDDEIKNKYQSPIATIFQTKGEFEFRQMELDALNELLIQCKQDTIIATGGGTACYNNTMELMNNNGITVWLDAKTKDIYTNITQENEVRPLFSGVKNNELVVKLDEMYNQREKFYKQSCTKVTVYRGLSPDLFTKRLHLLTFAK